MSEFAAFVRMACGDFRIGICYLSRWWYRSRFCDNYGYTRNQSNCNAGWKMIPRCSNSIIPLIIIYVLRILDKVVSFFFEYYE